jgi:hypothetical protein
MATKNQIEVKSNPKVLVLLEDENQVQDYLVREIHIPGEKTLIALSPFAMYELDRQRVTYKIIEDYVNSKTLFALGLNNYSKVEDICNLIDSHVHKKLPELKDLGIRPDFFSFFSLKVMYDSVTIRLNQLSKLIDCEKPDTILVYQSKLVLNNKINGVGYLLPNIQESIYSQLLNLHFNKINVETLPEISEIKTEKKGKKDVLVSNKLRNIVLKIVESNPIIYDFAVTFKKIGWNAGLRKFISIIVNRRKFHDYPVMLFGGGYNWDYCRDYFKNVQIAQILRVFNEKSEWIESESKAKNKVILDLWKEIKNDPLFRSHFKWDDFEFFPVLEEKFLFLIERVVPSCLRNYNEAAHLLKYNNIKALIVSTSTNCFAHIYSRAARNQQIPVIFWQHGNYSYSNHPMIVYNDIISSDYFLVFGEGILKKFNKDAEKYGTKLIPIGSAALDSLMNMEKKRDKKLTVLYASMTFLQNRLYISNSPPFSDNQQWLTLKNILNVLGKHVEIHTIIKMKPIYREPPIKEYSEEKGYDNFQFIWDEYGFIDLLPKADIIVLDVPSTILLQSLTTKKPIFVYTGQLNIDETALKMLNKRAYCYDDLNTFTSKLNEFLSGRGIGDVDYTNTEFLEHYGMYELDGKAGERAANTVKSIIETWEKK